MLPLKELLVILHLEKSGLDCPALSQGLKAFKSLSNIGGLALS